VTLFRDPRPVAGRMMPWMGTAVEGIKDREKIMVETIVANPKQNDSRCAVSR
jgi:hypothetical protein